MPRIDSGGIHTSAQARHTKAQSPRPRSRSCGYSSASHTAGRAAHTDFSVLQTPSSAQAVFSLHCRSLGSSALFPGTQCRIHSIVPFLHLIFAVFPSISGFSSLVNARFCPRQTGKNDKFAHVQRILRFYEKIFKSLLTIIRLCCILSPSHRRR